jgi:hypothetical protein
LSAGDDIPPLDDEARGVLEAERCRGDVAPHLSDAILRGVLTARLPGAAPPAPPAPKVDAPRSPLRWKVPMWTVPAALVVGAVAGGLAVRAQTPPAPPRLTPLPAMSIVIAAPAAPPKAAEPIASPSAEPSTSPSAEPPRHPSAAPSAAASAEPKSDTMPRERALLDVARTAFGKRDPRATIAALEQHRREFPNGKLAEERDALMIEALVEAGRGSEAKQRGAEFKASHPKSILAPAVDDALKSAP